MARIFGHYTLALHAVSDKIGLDHQISGRSNSKLCGTLRTL